MQPKSAYKQHECPTCSQSVNCSHGKPSFTSHPHASTAATETRAPVRREPDAPIRDFKPTPQGKSDGGQEIWKDQTWKNIVPSGKDNFSEANIPKGVNWDSVQKDIGGSSGSLSLDYAMQGYCAQNEHQYCSRQDKMERIMPFKSMNTELFFKWVNRVFWETANENIPELKGLSQADKKEVVRKKGFRWVDLRKLKKEFSSLNSAASGTDKLDTFAKVLKCYKNAAHNKNANSEKSKPHEDCIEVQNLCAYGILFCEASDEKEAHLFRQIVEFFDDPKAGIDKDSTWLKEVVHDEMFYVCTDLMIEFGELSGEIDDNNDERNQNLKLEVNAPTMQNITQRKLDAYSKFLDVVFGRQNTLTFEQFEQNIVKFKRLFHARALRRFIYQEESLIMDQELKISDKYKEWIYAYPNKFNHGGVATIDDYLHKIRTWEERPYKFVHSTIEANDGYKIKVYTPQSGR